MLNTSRMGIASVVGVMLAFVIAFMAVDEINGLQDLSKSLTSGAVETMFGTTTFIMLLVAVVIGLGAILAVAALLTGRR